MSTRAEQLRLNHVFNIFNDLSPPYMNDNFNRVNSLHSHNTRGSAYNFHIPKIKTAQNAYSFYFNAIKNWNSLPDSIKSTTQKGNFKRATRAHLLNQMNV